MNHAMQKERLETDFVPLVQLKIYSKGILDTGVYEKTVLERKIYICKVLVCFPTS